MCRQSITCLLPLYSRSQQQRYIIEYKETFDYINNYNKRFSGAPRPVIKLMYFLFLIKAYLIILSL
jgi:hypothetical protein